MPIDNNERSISSVLSNIVHNVQEIVRSEVCLARTEIAQEAGKAKTAGVLLGIGVLCGFLAAFFASFAAVFALTQFLPNWAAALIVATALGLGATFLVYVGRIRLRRVHLIPETVETFKETLQWNKP